jgi:hypothetical protein
LAITSLLAASTFISQSGAASVTAAAAKNALDGITIASADDVRGYITLPVILEGLPGTEIHWKSSKPDIVSDQAMGAIAPGAVKRPPVGAKPVSVILTACITTTDIETLTCRDFTLKVQPSVRLASFSRYGMSNFARSNNQNGQQVYMAYSVGNDATTWVATNGGFSYLDSTYGMHATRDACVIRSPEGDRFYLLATDLNVDGTPYGWQGWDWAQSNASRYIEVWESNDLRHWSQQRHLLVSSIEAGMTYAPEAIWDPAIGTYVVFWTSSLYPADTHYSANRSDPKGRYPLNRNVIMYATTRDFRTFTPAKVFSGRPNHGALDATIVLNKATGYYHRFVSDHTSTGINITRYISTCASEDIYQERSKSILAPPYMWELVEGCITHSTMNTTYAEAPLAIQANPGDPRGEGWYLYSDQKWAGSPSGQPLEEQLSPYWTTDIEKGDWKPIDWNMKPAYNGSLGVIRHGTIFALTTGEHAALRGADLVAVVVNSPPTKTDYAVGEELDLTGLVVSASYTDGIKGEIISEGHGGYLVSGFDTQKPGKQVVTVSYMVVNVIKTATFQVKVTSYQHHHAP